MQKLVVILEDHVTDEEAEDLLAVIEQDHRELVVRVERYKLWEDHAAITASDQ